MKNQPEALKSHKNRPGTMKTQSGTVKNHKNQPGVAQGGYRWLQDSKEEVMIFRYRQTNRHFIKIYINFSHWVGCNQVFKRTSSRNENKTHPLSKPTSSYSAFLPQVHRICCSVPFYHCFGNVAGTLAGLLHGASLIVPCPRFCGFWCPV